MDIETYQFTQEKNGNGTFFFTDYGNRMYSVNGKMAYHGVLCPKRLMQGKLVTLYIRGSKESNGYWSKKLKGEKYADERKTDGNSDRIIG